MPKRLGTLALLIVGVSYGLGLGAFVASLNADIYGVSALPFMGAILTFVLNTVAVAVAIVGLKRARASQTREGLARAIVGIVLGGLGFVGTAALMLWALITAVPGH